MPVLRRADCSAWLGVADRRLDLVYILLGGKRGKRSALSLARRAKDKAEKAKAKADKAAAGGGERVVAGVVAGVVDVAAVGAGGLGAGGHGVPGHAAAGRGRGGQDKSLCSSGLNGLVALGRYLGAVWSDRTARGPPLSRRHLIGGMAELVAPGGLPVR